MKEGWEVKKLGEFCDILNGFAFKSAKYSSQGTRIIRITNVQKGCVVDDVPKYYSEDDMAGLSQYRLRENDLLMSLTGNVGRVGLLTKELLPAALNQRVACLRIKDNNVSLRYLFYYLNSIFFEQEAILSSSGTAQKNMSTEWLKKYNIPLPPLPEQERIVSILDAEFAKIDAVKAGAEKSLQHAKDLFQAALKEELQPKEGWASLKLGKVADFVRGPFGGSLTKSIFKEKGYAVYEQQHAIHHHVNIRYFIDDEKFDEMKRFEVRPGDLIMSCSGTIGEVYIIPNDAPLGVINQALLKLSVSSKLDRYFFKSWLESPIFKNIVISHSKGAAIPNVPGVKILKDIDIALPSLPEQAEIVARLDALNTHCKTLQANYERTIALCDDMKQALLRKAFNGEL